jgi:hypothetical protein
MMQTDANERIETVSRGPRTTWRPLAVWLAVSAATLLAASSLPGAWRSARVGAGPDAVADLLVAGCATALTVALAWLWVVTTGTVAGLLTGKVRAGGGTTRRLVLVACGVAVVAGTTLPATASGGEGRELLVGLALPDRAVAPAAHRRHRPVVRTAAEPGAPDTYVVRPGDSLWSIARAHPGVATSVERRWRAIWQANRDLVGDDPDLILPGQALRLPDGTDHDHDRHEQDGD